MAQQYINPVELLGLSSISPEEIDSATLKKARRRLLADLDLSDGYHTYHGQQLDRSACELACADLDYPEKLKAWHRLANQPALSSFLANGRPDFLVDPPANTRFLKHDQELLKLIGPRYASQFDQILLQAFETDDVAMLQALEDAPALYPPALATTAYRGVTRAFRRQIEEIDELSRILDEDDDEQEASDALDDILGGCFHSSNLNALPAEHFEGLRSDFALSVRNYAVKLFNTFFETGPATHLLQSVAVLDIDGQTADRLEEDLEQIGQIAENNQIRAQQEEFAGRVGKVFEQLMAYQKQVDAGTASITAVQQWNAGLGTIIRQLNAETDKEAGTFREAMAQGLRSLSISIWNQNQSNGPAALAVLETGLSLTIPTETRSKIQADKQQLTRLVLAAASVRTVTPTRTAPKAAASANTTSDSSGLPGCVWWVGALLVIGFLMNMCSNSQKSSSYNEPTSTETTVAGEVVGDPTDTISDASTSTSPSTSSLPEQLPVYKEQVSKYRGNQLRNGSSPLDNCFGKGKYAGPAWIVFRNGNNGTDAIVCLARASTGKVIRNEYIKAGTDFKMSRIPAGTYYLKVFYGQDWNPTRKNACGTRGAFETDEHFSVSKSLDDQIRVDVSSTSYTTGEITLYTVDGGNMAQQPISEDEFFRQ